MYLLPCPSCQNEFPVSTAQAGNEIRCPSCEAAVPVPKLGELRQLARQDAEESDPKRARDRAANAESGGGRNMLFAAFGFIALGGLLCAAYCGIRWAILPAPMTMDQHFEEIDESLSNSSPAVLILEYREMEKYSLDMVVPYRYQRDAEERFAWARSAMIGGGICALGILLALATQVVGRPAKQTA